MEFRNWPQERIFARAWSFCRALGSTVVAPLRALRAAYTPLAQAVKLSSFVAEKLKSALVRLRGRDYRGLSETGLYLVLITLYP